MNIRKCAVIGCGNVGATTAYALMKSGLFSEIVLIDVDKKKAEGEAMDLNHGLPFNSPALIYAGDYADIYDSYLIIITAGAAQKPGETRLDLVKKNTAIFRSIIDNILEYNKKAILLVVTNPVDVLTYVTLARSGFPASRVIGSGTVLDTARLKQLIGQHFEVDSRNVHSFIIGEHGDSELPVFSSANISGVDIEEYCRISGKDIHVLDRLYDDVKNSAYHIIDAKGATYYAIAEAVLRICRALVRDENTIMPVSVLASGEYGIEDVCIGMPAIVGYGGVKRVLEIPLDRTERALLKKSADSLKEVIGRLDDAEILA